MCLRSMRQCGLKLNETRRLMLDEVHPKTTPPNYIPKLHPKTTSQNYIPKLITSPNYKPSCRADPGGASPHPHVHTRAGNSHSPFRACRADVHQNPGAGFNDGSFYGGEFFSVSSLINPKYCVSYRKGKQLFFSAVLRPPKIFRH